MLVGIVTVMAWPPSPLTEKAAEVGEGEANANVPVPVTVRTPLALSVTMPEPVVGRTILPKTRSAVFEMVIARNTLAVAEPVLLPGVPPPPDLVAITEKLATALPVVPVDLIGKSKPI